MSDAPDVIIGMQKEQVPVTEWRDAFYWSCEACGWQGRGLGSLAAAQNEAGHHFYEAHGKKQVTVERRDARALGGGDE